MSELRVRLNTHAIQQLQTLHEHRHRYLQQFPDVVFPLIDDMAQYPHKACFTTEYTLSRQLVQPIQESPNPLRSINSELHTISSAQVYVNAALTIPPQEGHSVNGFSSSVDVSQIDTIKAFNAIRRTLPPPHTTVQLKGDVHSSTRHLYALNFNGHGNFVCSCPSCSHHFHAVSHTSHPIAEDGHDELYAQPDSKAVSTVDYEPFDYTLVDPTLPQNDPLALGLTAHPCQVIDAYLQSLSTRRVAKDPSSDANFFSQQIHSYLPSRRAELLSYLDHHTTVVSALEQSTTRDPSITQRLDALPTVLSSAVPLNVISQLRWINSRHAVGIGSMLDTTTFHEDSQVKHLHEAFARAQQTVAGSEPLKSPSEVTADLRRLITCFYIENVLAGLPQRERELLRQGSTTPSATSSSPTGNHSPASTTHHEHPILVIAPAQEIHHWLSLIPHFSLLGASTVILDFEHQIGVATPLPDTALKPIPAPVLDSSSALLSNDDGLISCSNSAALTIPTGAQVHATVLTGSTIYGEISGLVQSYMAPADAMSSSEHPHRSSPPPRVWIVTPSTLSMLPTFFTQFMMFYTVINHAPHILHSAIHHHTMLTTSTPAANNHLTNFSVRNAGGDLVPDNTTQADHFVKRKGRSRKGVLNMGENNHLLLCTCQGSQCGTRRISTQLTRQMATEGGTGIALTMNDGLCPRYLSQIPSLGYILSHPDTTVAGLALAFAKMIPQYASLFPLQMAAQPWVYHKHKLKTFWVTKFLSTFLALPHHTSLILNSSAPSSSNHIHSFFNVVPPTYSIMDKVGNHQYMYHPPRVTNTIISCVPSVYQQALQRAYLASEIYQIDALFAAPFLVPLPSEAKRRKRVDQQQQKLKQWLKSTQYELPYDEQEVTVFKDDAESTTATAKPPPTLTYFLGVETLRECMEVAHCNYKEQVQVSAPGQQLNPFISPFCTAFAQLPLTQPQQSTFSSTTPLAHFQAKAVTFSPYTTNENESEWFTPSFEDVTLVHHTQQALLQTLVTDDYIGSHERDGTQPGLLSSYITSHTAGTTANHEDDIIFMSTISALSRGNIPDVSFSLQTERTLAKEKEIVDAETSLLALQQQQSRRGRRSMAKGSLRYNFMSQSRDQSYAVDLSEFAITAAPSHFTLLSPLYTPRKFKDLSKFQQIVATLRKIALHPYISTSLGQSYGFSKITEARQQMSSSKNYFETTHQLARRSGKLLMLDLMLYCLATVPRTHSTLLTQYAETIKAVGPNSDGSWPNPPAGLSIEVLQLATSFNPHLLEQLTTAPLDQHPIMVATPSAQEGLPPGPAVPLTPHLPQNRVIVLTRSERVSEFVRQLCEFRNIPHVQYRGTFSSMRKSLAMKAWRQGYLYPRVRHHFNLDEDDDVVSTENGQFNPFFPPQVLITSMTQIDPSMLPGVSNIINLDVDPDSTTLSTLLHTLLSPEYIQKVVSKYNINRTFNANITVHNLVTQETIEEDMLQLSQCRNVVKQCLTNPYYVDIQTKKLFTDTYPRAPTLNTPPPQQQQQQHFADGTTMFTPSTSTAVVGNNAPNSVSAHRPTPPTYPMSSVAHFYRWSQLFTDYFTIKPSVVRLPETGNGSQQQHLMPSYCRPTPPQLKSVLNSTLYETPSPPQVLLPLQTEPGLQPGGDSTAFGEDEGDDDDNTSSVGVGNKMQRLTTKIIDVAETNGEDVPLIEIPSASLLLTMISRASAACGLLSRPVQQQVIGETILYGYDVAGCGRYCMPDSLILPKDSENLRIPSLSSLYNEFRAYQSQTTRALDDSGMADEDELESSFVAEVSHRIRTKQHYLGEVHLFSLIDHFYNRRLPSPQQQVMPGHPHITTLDTNAEFTSGFDVVNHLNYCDPPEVSLVSFQNHISGLLSDALVRSPLFPIQCECCAEHPYYSSYPYHRDIDHDIFLTASQTAQYHTELAYSKRPLPSSLYYYHQYQEKIREVFSYEPSLLPPPSGDMVDSQTGTELQEGDTTMLLYNTQETAEQKRYLPCLCPCTLHRDRDGIYANTPVTIFNAITHDASQLYRAWSAAATPDAAISDASTSMGEDGEPPASLAYAVSLLQYIFRQQDIAYCRLSYRGGVFATRAIPGVVADLRAAVAPFPPVGPVHMLTPLFAPTTFPTSSTFPLIRLSNLTTSHMLTFLALCALPLHSGAQSGDHGGINDLALPVVDLAVYTKRDALLIQAQSSKTSNINYFSRLLCLPKLLTHLDIYRQLSGTQCFNTDNPAVSGTFGAHEDEAATAGPTSGAQDTSSSGMGSSSVDGGDDTDGDGGDTNLSRATGTNSKLTAVSFMNTLTDNNPLNAKCGTHSNVMYAQTLAYIMYSLRMVVPILDTKLQRYFRSIRSGDLDGTLNDYMYLLQQYLAGPLIFSSTGGILPYLQLQHSHGHSQQQQPSLSLELMPSTPHIMVPHNSDGGAASSSSSMSAPTPVSSSSPASHNEHQILQTIVADAQRMNSTPFGRFASHMATMYCRNTRKAMALALSTVSSSNALFARWKNAYESKILRPLFTKLEQLLEVYKVTTAPAIAPAAENAALQADQDQLQSLMSTTPFTAFIQSILECHGLRNVSFPYPHSTGSALSNFWQIISFLPPLNHPQYKHILQSLVDEHEASMQPPLPGISSSISLQNLTVPGVDFTASLPCPVDHINALLEAMSDADTTAGLQYGDHVDAAFIIPCVKAILAALARALMTQDTPTGQEPSLEIPLDTLVDHEEDQYGPLVVGEYATPLEVPSLLEASATQVAQEGGDSNAVAITPGTTTTKPAADEQSSQVLTSLELFRLLDRMRLTADDILSATALFNSCYLARTIGHVSDAFKAPVNKLPSPHAMDDTAETHSVDPTSDSQATTLPTDGDHAQSSPTDDEDQDGNDDDDDESDGDGDADALFDANDILPLVSSNQVADAILYGSLSQTTSTTTTIENTSDLFGFLLSGLYHRIPPPPAHLVLKHVQLHPETRGDTETAYNLSQGCGYYLTLRKRQSSVPAGAGGDAPESTQYIDAGIQITPHGVRYVLKEDVVGERNTLQKDTASNQLQITPHRLWIIDSVDGQDRVVDQTNSLLQGMDPTSVETFLASYRSYKQHQRVLEGLPAEDPLLPSEAESGSTGDGSTHQDYFSPLELQYQDDIAQEYAAKCERIQSIIAHAEATPAASKPHFIISSCYATENREPLRDHLQRQYNYYTQEGIQFMSPFEHEELYEAALALQNEAYNALDEQQSLDQFVNEWEDDQNRLTVTVLDGKTQLYATIHETATVEQQQQVYPHLAQPPSTVIIADNYPLSSTPDTIDQLLQQESFMARQQRYLKNKRRRQHVGGMDASSNPIVSLNDPSYHYPHQQPSYNAPAAVGSGNVADYGTEQFTPEEVQAFEQQGEYLGYPSFRLRLQGVRRTKNDDQYYYELDKFQTTIRLRCTTPHLLDRSRLAVKKGIVIDNIYDPRYQLRLDMAYTDEVLNTTALQQQHNPEIFHAYLQHCVNRRPFVRHNWQRYDGILSPLSKYHYNPYAEQDLLSGSQRKVQPAKQKPATFKNCRLQQTVFDSPVIIEQKTRTLYILRNSGIDQTLTSLSSYPASRLPYASYSPELGATTEDVFAPTHDSGRTINSLSYAATQAYVECQHCLRFYRLIETHLTLDNLPDASSFICYRCSVYAILYKHLTNYKLVSTQSTDSTGVWWSDMLSGFLRYTTRASFAAVFYPSATAFIPYHNDDHADDDGDDHNDNHDGDSPSVVGYHNLGSGSVSFPLDDSYYASYVQYMSKTNSKGIKDRVRLPSAVISATQMQLPVIPHVNTISRSTVHAFRQLLTSQLSSYNAKLKTISALHDDATSPNNAIE